MKWKKNTVATNYRVYVSENDSNNFILITNTSITNFKHTFLPPACSNYYIIIAESNNVDLECTPILLGRTYPETTYCPSSKTNFFTNKGIIYTYDRDKYRKPTNEFVIMTLNMHTYQEAYQDSKFDLIVRTIAEMDIDFIALQECAQKNSTEYVTNGIRVDNMALILCKRLYEYYNLKYYFIWTWAHYGFSVYEEGVAVLSKYPIIYKTNRYITSDTSTYSISSRKVIYGACDVPGLGIVNVFSGHFQWQEGTTEDYILKFSNQIENAKRFVYDYTNNSILSILCGDFNDNAAANYPYGNGYRIMTYNNEFIDTFHYVHPDANTIPPISAYYTILGTYPGRIDYIYMLKNELFFVIYSQIIFTSSIIGKVSDHYGVVTRIGLK